MKYLRYIIFILFIVVSLQSTYAQNPPPPPDGGGGEGTVIDAMPLNFLIYPFMLLGAYLGYRFIRKSSK